MLPLASMRIATLAGLASDQTLLERSMPVVDELEVFGLEVLHHPAARIPDDGGNRHLLDAALEDDSWLLSSQRSGASEGRGSAGEGEGENGG